MYKTRKEARDRDRSKTNDKKRRKRENEREREIGCLYMYIAKRKLIENRSQCLFIEQNICKKKPKMHAFAN